MARKNVLKSVENAAPKWEHIQVTEEKDGRLLRLIAEDGYILQSKSGVRRQSVLTDPKRAEGWSAVEVKQTEK